MSVHPRMSLSAMMGSMRASREALLHTFRPPFDATSREVRVHGAVTVGIGALLFLLGSALIVWAQRFDRSITRIAAPLVLPAYVLVIVGGYRVLMGREPHTAEVGLALSWRRIAVGVFSVVLLMLLLFGLMFLGGWMLGPK